MPSSVLLESSAPRRGRRCAHARTPSRCFRGSPPACAAARFTHKAVASFGTATFASARLPYMYKDFSSVAPLMGARFASPAGEALRPPAPPPAFSKAHPLHALPLASRTKPCRRFALLGLSRLQPTSPMFCHRNTNQRLGSKQKASFGTTTFVSARLPHMYKDLSSVAPLMGARFASPAGEALRPPPHPLPLF